jgi:hypothetical protein
VHLFSTGCNAPKEEKMVVAHLVKRLTEGLDTHVRADGTVIRLHAGDKTIGEVVIGEETLRVNVKELTDDAELIAQAEGLDFTGRSKAWHGGVRVSDENVDAVRGVLDAVAEEATADRQRTRSLREALMVIEQAKKNGTLDQQFEKELRSVLGRSKSQRSTGGTSRGRTRRARAHA